MKFDLGEAPPLKLIDKVVRVGNVYAAKGGVKPHLWIVAAVNDEKSVTLIGLDIQGEIVSATNYAMHAFERRECIGFCPEIADMQLTIQWRSI